MESLGNFFGQSRDNYQISYRSRRLISTIRTAPFPEVVFFVIVRPVSRAHVKSAIDEITDILRQAAGVCHGRFQTISVSPHKTRSSTFTIN